MLIKTVTTMAKVIEPIAHLSLRLFRHNTKNACNTFIPFTFSNFDILPSIGSSVGNMRFMSTSLKHCTNFTSLDDMKDVMDPNPSPRKKTSRNKLKPVPKKNLDPEKVKKALTVMQLHKTNREMFGELLETSQQKTKRVNKETKKLKKLVEAVPIRDDDYYLNPILDPTALNDETVSLISPADSITTPRFVPTSEKIKIAPSNDSGSIKVSENHYWGPTSHENKNSVGYRKEAEINWTLKTTRGMTRVLKGNFYNDPSSKATATHQSQSLKISEAPGLHSPPMYDIGFKKERGRDSLENRFKLSLGTNNDETGQEYSKGKMKESRGASSSPPGQPSPMIRDAAAPSSTETNDFPSNSGPRNQIISIPFPRFSKSKPDNDNEVNNGDDLSVNPNTKLPSVSKILSATMPKEQAAALERWQAKMISEMGEDGFRIYKENMLNNGKMLHSNIENFLRGTPMSEILVPDSINGHWNSLKNILPEVEDVFVLESRVVHPSLKYCGIVDCVAIFRNKLVVIDWKTSQKQKPFVSMTYDTPLQISAYVGAINYDPNYSLKSITEGLIVIAYEDGKTGHTFLLKPEDMLKYWDKWTQRLKAFYALNQTESI